MAFKKIDAQTRPPRQWALVGYPGGGKSTFAAQMRGPLLVIDSDHRFAEVAGLAAGEVYELSENPVDHVDPRRIAELLRQNMTGAGVRTVVVDSLTAIMAPITTLAVMANDAGENKNRISAFKDKALALRLLQDSITSWGCDTLWIYHHRDARDGQAKAITTTTISAVELARLRRSLNMQIAIVQDGQRRGVKVEWARRGRSGLTLWDDTGCWQGMPERIEAAVYEGLTPAEQQRIEQADPTTFSGAADAIGWAHEKGCFRDAVHAQNAYEELKRTARPQSASEMWRLWVAEVNRRIAETRIERTPA